MRPKSWLHIKYSIIIDNILQSLYYFYAFKIVFLVTNHFMITVYLPHNDHVNDVWWCHIEYCIVALMMKHIVVLAVPETFSSYHVIVLQLYGLIDISKIPHWQFNKLLVFMEITYYVNMLVWLVDKVSKNIKSDVLCILFVRQFT